MMCANGSTERSAFLNKCRTPRVVGGRGGDMPTHRSSERKLEVYDVASPAASRLGGTSNPTALLLREQQALFAAAAAMGGRSQYHANYHHYRKFQVHGISTFGESLRFGAILGLLFLERCLRILLMLTYHWFPLKGVLDVLFEKTRFLQGTFSQRFEGPRPELAHDTAELIAQLGLACEEYETLTEDGFHLVLHRLRSKEPPVGERIGDRPPVLLMHGLLMSDEVFVCEPSLSLALYLFERGYDVWLGNNRGNKHSWRHQKYDRGENAYWDFSIDDLAHYDVPTMVNEVTTLTGSSSLTYIGFSNGSAQMFAALATNREVAERVNLFIALSPACKLIHLHPDSVALQWLYPLLGSSRRLFSWIFGKQAFLAVTHVWQQVLSERMYDLCILFCLKSLFNWDTQMMDRRYRTKFFAYLYSTTSTKAVHHWFRMLRTGRFEAYEDQLRANDRSICRNAYRLSRITQTPVALIYGGRDRLSDVEWIKSQLPTCRLAHCVPRYEHLDFLAGVTVRSEVFPVIEALMSEYSHPLDETGSCCVGEGAQQQLYEQEDEGATQAEESTVEPTPASPLTYPLTAVPRGHTVTADTSSPIKAH